MSAPILSCMLERKLCYCTLNARGGGVVILMILRRNLLQHLRKGEWVKNVYGLYYSWPSLYKQLLWCSSPFKSPRCFFCKPARNPDFGIHAAPFCGCLFCSVLVPFVVCVSVVCHWSFIFLVYIIDKTNVVLTLARSKHHHSCLINKCTMQHQPRSAILFLFPFMNLFCQRLLSQCVITFKPNTKKNDMTPTCEQMKIYNNHRFVHFIC